MTILLFGKNGMIGSNILERSKLKIVSFGKEDLDISDINKIKYNILKYKPKIIINSAAFTDVNQSENKKKYVKRINADSLKTISKISKEIGAVLIHFSTDYVFDGKKNKPYKENDKTNPLQYYGKTKVIAENNIIKSGCKYLIFRTSWIYSKDGNNFVNKILKKLKKNNKIYVVDDEYGTPTSSDFIAINILRIIKKIYSNNFKFTSGIYNLSPTGVVSRYNFANYINKYYKKKYNLNCKILRVSTTKLKLNIARPKKVNLSKMKVIKEFNLKIINWKKEFIRYIK